MNIVAPSLLTLTLTLLVPACDAPDSPATDLQKIGEPSWQLVDFHRFSAPVGTAATQYVEASQTQATLLPAPHHEPHPALGIGPGAPHIDPYWKEFEEGLANAGYLAEDPFAPADVNNGKGLFTVWMAVPRPGHTEIGSSPDYNFGPVIPNDVFPIHLSSDLYRDGVKLSTHVEFDVPALDAIDPPFAVDGHSHFPMFLWYWWGGAGTPKPGEYAWHITMTDATGAGWSVRVPAELLGAQARDAQQKLGPQSLAAESGTEDLHVGVSGG